MLYTFLIVKGVSLDGNPISKMTRKQTLAIAIAYKIESDVNKKAQNKSSRGYKGKR